ncbi:MAG TPA: diacylglycerol kinase family protein [Rectinemataceae bacterium]|nr:diacylglycerol kinase family protein [Rectinemataceae bacterium]
MHPEELADGLEYILARSPALPGRIASSILIANPKAGGFTRRSFARRRHAELQALVGRAASLPLRPDPIPFRLRLTDSQGHAAALAHEYFAETESQGPKDSYHLLMMAGGDGTSLETLVALMQLPPERRSRYLVLRLPFGTGNDGSDGRELDSCLGRFLGPCRVASSPAMSIRRAAAGKETLWTFNIASLGADAFIAHMTNRLKTSFPGDSYKIWVDIASVLYDSIWPSRPIRVRAFSADGKVAKDFVRDLLLVAVGVTGRRQYGSNKQIFPDDDNVIVLSRMSLFRKLAVKGPIYAGRCRSLPEAELFSARRIVVEHDSALLFQADGEVWRFEAEDFPAEFEILPDSYQVLAGA